MKLYNSKHMSIREDLKSLLAKENMTMREMAKRRGISLQSLSNKLCNKTIKFEEVREIADILGYDIKFEKR